jgi:hypothetical protein
MNHSPLPPDDSWESDAVWKLLDQAAPAPASPRFVEDVVRAARLDAKPAAWWTRLMSPAPLTGFAAAVCVLALGFVTWMGPAATESPSLALDSASAAEIQDIAERETLLAAIDQIDDFSDHELVNLIGY